MYIEQVAAVLCAMDIPIEHIKQQKKRNSITGKNFNTLIV